MSKEQFVTNNLHRISDKIAEVAKKHEQELSQWKNPPKKPLSAPPVSGEEPDKTLQSLPEETPSEVSAPEKENIGAKEENAPAVSQEDEIRNNNESLPAAKKEEEENEDDPAYSTDMEILAITHPARNGEKRQRLSDSMEAALQRHHEEGLRLRRDLQMLLESTCAETIETGKAFEEALKENKKVEEALENMRKEFSLLAFPDQDSPEYQMLLAALYRKMDKMKVELLHLKAKSDRLSSRGYADGENMKDSFSTNIFAEMHSLKKQELFRTGLWLGFPLVLGLIIASLLMAAALLLTFRVGL